MSTQPHSPQTDPVPAQVLLVRDFINTIEWQEDHDTWTAPADLQQWFLDRADLTIEDQSEADLRLARRLREGLRSILLRHAGHDPLPTAEQHLNQVLAQIPLVMRADHGTDLRLGSPTPGAHPLAYILAAVQSAQISGDWHRLKVCARDSCRWAYWDASRNKSGRWCSMSWCGNYVKMRTRNGNPLTADELQPRDGEHRPARMVDVAAIAGVSMKTVSNVVNDTASISATTRARVEAAIRELDYRPNLIARALRNGSHAAPPDDSSARSE